MKERVRAVLLTPDRRLLLIKRTRPGHAPYWVLPGGGVEDTDPGREGALERELREELAATAEIHSLLHVIERPDERQYIYLARVRDWSFTHRVGPEFSDPTRGSYELEEVPATVAGLSTIDVKPDEIAAFLCEHLSSTDDLFSLPDLR